MAQDTRGKRGGGSRKTKFLLRYNGICAHEIKEQIHACYALLVRLEGEHDSTKTARIRRPIGVKEMNAKKGKNGDKE